MQCFICSKELPEGYLCEAHTKELYDMLQKGTNIILTPDWNNHCLICGEYVDKIIVDHPNCGPICDRDIREEFERYSTRE
jgi:hypothetical protein